MKQILTFAFAVLFFCVAKAEVVDLVMPWSPDGTTDKVAQVILTHARPDFAKNDWQNIDGGFNKND